MIYKIIKQPNNEELKLSKEHIEKIKKVSDWIERSNQFSNWVWPTKNGIQK
jgi:hypothetical protein